LKRKSITIPISIALSNEKAWERLDKKGTSFFVIRFHFQVNERLLNETHKVGDWIGFYQSTKGMSAQHVESETASIEKIHSLKSIENHLLESELLGEIAVDLVNSFELPKLLKVGSTVKGKVTSKLKDAYTLGQEILDSHKVTNTHKLEITNHYAPEETDAIVSVPVYRRRSCDIVLSFIDYLKVDYKRSPLGLRKKSKKYPPINDPRKHGNVYKVGTPIATVYYWELQHNASKFMYEKDHKPDVTDPTQITICEPITTKEGFVEFPSVPNLYQIAKAAFPHKWIWRKPENNDWTEEDLKKIELEEVKGKANGWYSLYGERKR